jgi:hypothetical protein
VRPKVGLELLTQRTDLLSEGLDGDFDLGLLHVHKLHTPSADFHKTCGAATIQRPDRIGARRMQAPGRLSVKYLLYVATKRRL